MPVVGFLSSLGREIAQLDRQLLTWPSLVNVIVHDGTVELWGMIDSDRREEWSASRLR